MGAVDRYLGLWQADWIICSALWFYPVSISFSAAHCGKHCPLSVNSHYHLSLSTCDCKKASRSGLLKFPYTERRVGTSHQILTCDLSHGTLNLSASQIKAISSCLSSHCLWGTGSYKVQKVSWMGNPICVSMVKSVFILCRNLKWFCCFVVIPALLSNPSPMLWARKGSLNTCVCWERQLLYSVYQVKNDS